MVDRCNAHISIVPDERVGKPSLEKLYEAI